MRESLKLTVTTARATLPVSLNELKAQLNLGDVTDDDPLLVGYLSTAVEACEKYTGRATISTTYTLFRDDWPSDRRREPWWDGVREGAISELRASARNLELPRPPLQSVTHVKSYDDSDNATTFATSNYFVDTVSEPGRVVLRNGSAAPSITRAANGLEVQFVAGYGDDPHDVPEQLRQGILMLATYLYEHRGECPVEEATGKSGAAGQWGQYRILRV